MPTIKVIWIRHCKSTSNVISPLLAVFGKLSRKSIIDPLCTIEGCNNVYQYGNLLFSDVENYINEESNARTNNLIGGNKSTEFKYYCSILPRAMTTMQFLLLSAGKSKEKIQRLFYIQEKENFKNPSVLNAENVDFNKWKEHMHGKKALSIDVIKKTTMGLAVGSTSVTNKFKSDMYANVLNKLPHLPKVKQGFKELKHLDKDDFEFQVHSTNDHDLFMDLLQSMFADKEISENTVLYVVGHGDYIKEYVLKQSVNYNNTLSCCSDCGFVKTGNVMNLDAHLVSYDLYDKTFTVDKCFPFKKRGNKTMPHNSQLAYEKLLTAGLLNKQAHYHFGHILKLNGFTAKMFSHSHTLKSKLNPSKKYDCVSMSNDFRKACILALRSVSNNEIRKTIPSNFKFGGKKSSTKSFIRKINGKKRRIYLGPKGGKYYIKKDSNNNKKNVYIK